MKGPWDNDPETRPRAGAPWDRDPEVSVTPLEGGFAPREAREGKSVDRKEAMRQQIREDRAPGKSLIGNTISAAGSRLATGFRSALGAIPFADDLVAHAATIVPSDLDYSQPYWERFGRNRDYVEAQHDVDWEKDKVSSLAGTVGGSMVGPGARYVAEAPGFFSLLGRSAGVGAGYGAATGLSSNGSASERVEQGLKQGVVGGVAGAALPAATRGVGYAVGDPLIALGQRFRGWRDPEGTADRLVAGALARDDLAGRRLPNHLIDAARENGQPLVLGDMGGDMTRALARTSANASPEAAGTMSDVLDPRYLNQNNRIGSFISSLFDFPSPMAMRDRLREAARMTNSRAYTALQNDFPIVQTPELLQMVREVPEVQQAAAEVLRRQPGRFAAGMSQTRRLDADLPSIEFWDLLQRELRDRANSARGERANEMSTLYNGLRNRINGEVDRLTGGRFGETRAGAARFFGAEDAIEAGQNFFRMRGLDDLTEVRRALAQMDDGERRMFAQGFAAEMAHAAQGTGDTRNIAIQSWANSPIAREKMALAMGPERAERVQTALTVEEGMNRLRNRLKGGSDTTRQLMEAGVLGAGVNFMASGDFNLSNLHSPEGFMIAAARAFAKRGGGISPNVAESIARRLASRDPRVVNRVLAAAERDKGYRATARYLEGVLTRVIGTESDEVPGVEPHGPRASYAEGGEVQGPPQREIPEADFFAGEKALAQGALGAAQTAGRYLRDTPVSQMPRDAGRVAGAVWEGVKEDPVGAALDMTPVVGEIRSAMDAREALTKAEEAEKAGDPALADKLRQIASVAAAGAIPAAGVGARAAKRAAKVAETAVEEGAGAAAKAAKAGITAGDAAVDAEHSMGLERGERFTIAPNSVRLTDAEKAIVNSFSSPAEQAKVASAIRAKKANYPVSDGWAPMEATRVNGFNDKGEPQIEWQASSYGFNRAKDEPRPPRRGTPEYDKLVKGVTRNSLKEIENIIARAEAGDEAAKVILRQAGWYRETMRKGFDERGGAYPAFADILGGTSPNTSVDQNYAYSVDLQKRFARGDFDEPVAFARDYQGSLNEFPEDQLLRRNDAFDENGVGKQYGMNSRNAAMAMADRWREEVPGQAPKARNFSGNLGGQTDKATIDVWAARFLNRMAGRKRLPPGVESGVGGSLGKDLRAGGEFGFGQDAFQRLADELNRKGNLLPYLKDLGYNNVTPMDLQALTWFIEKEHWGKNRWTTKAGEGGSFEDEMRKFPTERWQSGFSVQQAEPPTDDAMLAARRAVEAPLKQDDGVRVFRVNPTYGRYAGSNERSFDVELSAKPGWDPRQWMASVIDQAKRNNQYDVFFSRRLPTADAVTNPNARPGVEVYFKTRQDMEKILPMLEEFTKRGADGFTFVTDLKLRERLAGGKDVPDYVGVRLQFVPEITARWDDEARNAWTKDPAALRAAMDDAAERMQQAVNAIGQHSSVVDARMHFYDTLTVGRESYDNFLAGIADPENGAGLFEGPARAVDPLKRFGQPVHSHVEGRDHALRAGSSRGPEDNGGAVSGVVGGNPLTKARGGPVRLPSLKDTDRHIHATASLEGRRFAMGGPVFPAVVEPRLTRRGALETLRHR